MKHRKSLVSYIVVLGLLALPLLAAENLLKPTNKAETWRLEQHEGAKAKLEIEGEAAVFTVTEASGTDWHVQAILPGLVLKNNQKYAFSFSAKADDEREVRANAGIDADDWHLVGLDEGVQLTKEWKKYSYEFTASDVHAKANRISFIIGGAKGKIWIKDCVLTAK